MNATGALSPSAFDYLVVPHTHWDREWYVPFETFRLRLASTLDEVLDVLERDGSFSSFTLDGQAIVLEDYLDLRPENEPRLRALLGSGRIEVGPWYVLADEVLVGGEALVRNLLLGRRICRRFGVEPTTAGYAPDSFGHPAQMPQLLGGFGLGTFLFSRGLGDEIDDVGVVFRWRAAGDDVVACQFLPHYDNFARLESAADAGDRLERIVGSFGERLERAGCSTILLANGSDHLPIEAKLPQLCSELEESLGASVRIGRYSDYQPAAEHLPVFEGELLGSRLQNVLRGVNSARIYLKQANERAERRLLATETTAALRSLRDGSTFPGSNVRVAWRDLLRNHPHDSICGCSCDEVHRDMLVRYEQLDRTIDVLSRDALGEGDAYVNTLPDRRSRLVSSPDGRPRLIELDGFTGAAGRTVASPVKRHRLEPAADGTFSVVDLQTGSEFTGLHALEDEPDIGDLYTFCSGGPVRGPDSVDSRLARDDGFVQELVITAAFPGIDVETSVSVIHGTERVEVRTAVTNASKDHRLRVRFPVETDDRVVRAESQFAVVRRPVEPYRARTAWAEPPVTTAHSLGAVALGPLALMTKGLPEYEADVGGLRLTLIRSVGLISRPSGLPTRPLRAGPPLPTPEGQCLGRHVFEYSLHFDAEQLSDAALLRAGQDYREDLGVGEPFEAPLAIEGDVVFSSLKGAEDGNGYVLRLFNPNSTPEQVRISGVTAERIRLDEESVLDRPDQLEPSEIATYRIGC